MTIQISTQNKKQENVGLDVLNVSSKTKEQ